MVKINFPSFLCEVSPLGGSNHDGIFSLLVINRTWYQGEKFMPKNAIFWTFQSLKIDFLLANFIKAQETG